MTTALKNALASLGPTGPLAIALQEHLANGEASSDLRRSEIRRQDLHALLKLIADYEGAGVLKLSQIPTSFLSKVYGLSKAVRTSVTIDLSVLLPLLDSVWDVRGEIADFVLAAGTTHSGERVREAEQLLEQLRAAKKHFDRTTSRIDRSLAGAEKAANRSRASKEEAIQSQSRAAKAAAATNKAASKAEERLRSATLHAEAAATARRDALKAKDSVEHEKVEVKQIRQHLAELLTSDTDSINKHVELRKRIEAELEDTNQKARKIFFAATTAALAKEWRKKRIQAQVLMGIIGAALLVWVTLAAVVSLLMVWPRIIEGALGPESLQTFEERIALKAFALPVFAFALWFLASQFAHARDQASQYGDKEAVAMTLDSYRMFLNQAAEDNPEKKDRVFDLFSNAISKLYTNTLGDSSKDEQILVSLFGKKRELSLEDALALIQKLKSS